MPLGRFVNMFKRQLVIGAIVLIAGLFFWFRQDAPRNKHVPDRDDMVVVCDSEGAKTYHKDKNCSALKNCEHSLDRVTRGQANKDGHRACKLCFYKK